MLFRPRLRYFSSARPTLDLHHFIKSASDTSVSSINSTNAEPLAPYLVQNQVDRRKVFLETYGCQMNFNDTEIVLGILKNHGGFDRASSVEAADIVLLMTCAIRENAESKIWNRLDSLRAYERNSGKNLTIGVLGCMAERLKETLLEKKKNVDIVCGPDAYRSLPGLLQKAEMGQAGVNVMLSFDETYADVAPVRLDDSKMTSFISIMRGCDNMCAFCIVPFTRGRERSRPIESIVEETLSLRDQGVKEITLLGQNVNSYRDESQQSSLAESMPMSEGFKTVYRPKLGGLRFSSLLDRVSQAVPDVRIRFISPHPKDFPDDLLYLMKERSNICKQIHLPAQSGSTAVLERMRRGYSREAYLALVEHIRSLIPNVTLSSDFIVGFCGETEQDHLDTLSLVQQVDYDMAYMFAYSMREKTMAHRRYSDDVPEEVKQRRLRELIDTFYSGLVRKSQSLVGAEEVVMIDGPSKKDPGMFAGRTDGNRTIVFSPSQKHKLAPGDLVRVKITSISGSTPVGEVIDEDKLILN